MQADLEALKNKACPDGRPSWVVLSSPGLYLKHVRQGLYRPTTLLRADRLSHSDAQAAAAAWEAQGYQPRVLSCWFALGIEIASLETHIANLEKETLKDCIAHLAA